MTPEQMRAAEMQMFDNEFLMRTPIGEGLTKDPLAAHGLAAITYPHERGGPPLMHVYSDPRLEAQKTLGIADVGAFGASVGLNPKILSDENAMAQTFLHEMGHQGSMALQGPFVASPPWDLEAFRDSRLSEEHRQRNRDKTIRGREPPSALPPRLQALDQEMQAKVRGIPAPVYDKALVDWNDVLTEHAQQGLARKYPGMR